MTLPLLPVPWETTTSRGPQERRSALPCYQWTRCSDPSRRRHHKTMSAPPGETGFGAETRAKNEPAALRSGCGFHRHYVRERKRITNRLVCHPGVQVWVGGEHQFIEHIRIIFTVENRQHLDEMADAVCCFDFHELAYI